MFWESSIWGPDGLYVGHHSRKPGQYGPYNIHMPRNMDRTGGVTFFSRTNAQTQFHREHKIHYDNLRLGSME